MTHTFVRSSTERRWPPSVRKKLGFAGPTRPLDTARERTGPTRGERIHRSESKTSGATTRSPRVPAPLLGPVYRGAPAWNGRLFLGRGSARNAGWHASTPTAQAIALLLLSLLFALPAKASDGTAGRLRVVQVLHHHVDGVGGLFAPRMAAVSPDGAHVYVISALGDSLAVFWRDTNGCVGTAPDERVESGASACEAYTNCNGGVRVGLCSVLASDTARTDSTYPGHQTYLNPDIDVARTAWTFLSQFRLPEE